MELKLMCMTSALIDVLTRCLDPLLMGDTTAHIRMHWYHTLAILQRYKYIVSFSYRNWSNRYRYCTDVWSIGTDAVTDASIGTPLQARLLVHQSKELYQTYAHVVREVRPLKHPVPEERMVICYFKQSTEVRIQQPLRKELPDSLTAHVGK